MTYDARTRPHQLRPTDAAGAIVADGTYVMAVVDGTVDGLVESEVLPAGGATATTLAKVSAADGDVEWVTSSVPTILLPAGSTAATVAALSPPVPVPCIVRIKA